MFEERQLAQVFELLARVAEAVASAVGPNCRVTVHDLRTPLHTVIAAHGRGGAMDDPAPPSGAAMPWDSAEGMGNHVSVQTEGEQVASSVWVRDATGHIVGALTVSYDFSGIAAATDLLRRAVPSALLAAGRAGQATAGVPAEQRIAEMIGETVRALRKPLHAFDRDDRVALVRALDEAGIFAIRRAADIVARELGISRASVYAYLRAARGGTDGPEEPL
jgi:predicted transcriptional regulator YheO